MAQSVIGALRVNLGLDSAQFQKGMTNAQKSMRSAGKQFRVIARAAGIVATALGGLTASAASAAGEIDRLSDVANTTPETLQRWAAATATVGIEQEKLSDILKDVSDRVGDFLTTGGGPMADFFENIAPQVGVTAEQFRNLSGPQALQLFVSSLDKANISQAEATFYMEAMASDATALLPLLRDNGSELDRLANNASRLGQVLDNEAVASLRSANDALRSARASVGGLTKQIGASFAPALEKVSNYIANAVSGLSMLVRALRASGGAMAVLKSVAVEVFGKIVMAFDTVPLAVRIGSNSMKEFFLSNLADMAESFVDFTADVADSLNSVFNTNLTPLGGSMASAIRSSSDAAADASGSARQEMDALTNSIRAPLQSLEDFKETLYDSSAASDEAARAISDFSGAVGSATGGGGNSGVSGLTDNVQTLAQTIRDDLGGALSDVGGLLMNFAQSGFRDIKSLGSGLKSALSNGLSGILGKTGLTSAFKGGASFLGSGISAGFSSGGIGGAISGGISSIGTALAGATGGLGGLAAAAGALMPVVVGVGLLFKGLKKTTKTLDSGLKVSVNGLNVAASSFKKVQTSRFFGLSKKTKTSTSSLGGDDPLVLAVQDIQTSGLNAARVLGTAADAFAGFSYDFKLSLNGLTEDQKVKKINDELAKLGDEFASLVPGIENMNDLLSRSAQISQGIKAITDRQGLFATSSDAVFAAAAGNSVGINDVDRTSTKLDDILNAIITGDVNNARLTAQLVSIEQRNQLEAVL